MEGSLDRDRVWPAIARYRAIDFGMGVTAEKISFEHAVLCCRSRDCSVGFFRPTSNRELGRLLALETIQDLFCRLIPTHIVWEREQPRFRDSKHNVGLDPATQKSHTRSTVEMGWLTCLGGFQDQQKTQANMA